MQRVCLISLIFVSFGLAYSQNLFNELALGPTEVLYAWAACGLYYLLELLLSWKRQADQYKQHKAELLVLQDAGKKLQTKFDQVEKDNTLLQNEREELRDKLTELSLSAKKTEQTQAEQSKAIADSKKRVELARQEKQESGAEVLTLLSVLQEKGRLLDFLMDDIAAYDDGQVGAAARIVHEGCGKVLKEHFSISPLHSETEGQRVVVQREYNPAEFRIVGTAPENAPFEGTLLHRGWRADEVSLPKLIQSESATQNASILAPAEIEL